MSEYELHTKQGFYGCNPSNNQHFSPSSSSPHPALPAASSAAAAAAAALAALLHDMKGAARGPAEHDLSRKRSNTCQKFHPGEVKKHITNILLDCVKTSDSFMMLSAKQLLYYRVVDKATQSDSLIHSVKFELYTNYETQTILHSSLLGHWNR